MEIHAVLLLPCDNQADLKHQRDQKYSVKKQNHARVLAESSEIRQNRSLD